MKIKLKWKMNENGNYLTKLSSKSRVLVYPSDKYNWGIDIDSSRKILLDDDDLELDGYGTAEEAMLAVEISIAKSLNYFIKEVNYNDVV